MPKRLIAILRLPLKTIPTTGNNPIYTALQQPLFFILTGPIENIFFKIDFSSFLLLKKFKNNRSSHFFLF
jgi:hypothetical protein